MHTPFFFKFSAKAAALFSGVLALMGCRLYEPERYTRLQFAPGVEPIRVLMIGNSLTYYNDLPGLLQQLSARESRPIYVEKITTFLASLKFHWETDDSRKRIAAGGGGGRWDYVIVQEYSRMPVTDPDESAKYYGLFNDEIKRAGAKMIVYENWTRADRDDEYAALYAGYQKIVQQTQGIFAPIGEAFREAKQRRADVELMLDDRHPTDAGTYLAAAVLYDVIYGKKSADLPPDLKGPEVPPSIESSLRAIADKVVAAPGGVP